MEPIIAESARKWGVADEDMLHAYRNPIFDFDLDEGFVMIVGPDRAGNLIEVGYTSHVDGPTIIHAYRPARLKFLR